VVKGRSNVLQLLKLLVWSFLVLTAGAPRALAHPEPAPTLVNRYVTLAPAEARLGVQLTLLYGALPAGELRRQIDTDGDGKLSPQELGRQRLVWLQRIGEPTPMLRLTMDGRPTPLAFTLKIDLGGDSGTGAQPLLIDVVATVDLDPGEHRLEVVLGPDLPRMGETEVMLDATNPWSLRGTYDAEGRPVATQPLVRYPGRRSEPDEKRGGGFLIRSDGPLGTQGEGPGLAVPIALVGLATLMGVVLTLLVRRMDRRPGQDRRAAGGPEGGPTK
jgi:hypothetical protein